MPPGLVHAACVGLHSLALTPFPCPPHGMHAGAAQSVEANPDFAGELQAALQATNSQLPMCAVPAQLAG